MPGLLATLALAVAILTYDEVIKQHRVPQPQHYMHAAVVWAILGVIAEMGADNIAALIGLGLVLAMLYSRVSNKGSIGDAVGGETNVTVD